MLNVPANSHCHVRKPQGSRTQLTLLPQKWFADAATMMPAITVNRTYSTKL
jgi:hypothetical protein